MKSYTLTLLQGRIKNNLAKDQSFTVQSFKWFIRFDSDTTSLKFSPGRFLQQYFFFPS